MLRAGKVINPCSSCTSVWASEGPYNSTRDRGHATVTLVTCSLKGSGSTRDPRPGKTKITSPLCSVTSEASSAGAGFKTGGMLAMA